MDWKKMNVDETINYLCEKEVEEYDYSRITKQKLKTWCLP